MTVKMMDKISDKMAGKITGIRVCNEAQKLTSLNKFVQTEQAITKNKNQ